MMHTIHARNVHGMLQECCWWLKTVGVKEETRNGPVVAAPEPVIVCYGSPIERVLLWPERKANPFFHLFEALWMLAGRKDVGYVAQFNPRMKEFSDDGVSIHGAYGFRWRYGSGGDQLIKVIRYLKQDNGTRRAVIAMWDVYSDLGYGGVDVPCNTHIYFREYPKGFLNMTVCNRSNDLIWGMCGSNVVHFSMLHEFICHAVGMVMGKYYHFTNNLHIYDEVPKRELYTNPFIKDWYTSPDGVVPRPLCTLNWNLWLKECEQFTENPEGHFEDQFFNSVAQPMRRAWQDQSAEPLKECIAEDWRRAGEVYFAGKTT